MVVLRAMHAIVYSWQPVHDDKAWHEGGYLMVIRSCWVGLCQLLMGHGPTMLKVK